MWLRSRGALRIRGCPKMFINVDQVELLHSGGYTLDEIADSFLVVANKYLDISDRELDNIIDTHIVDETMIQGILMCMGHLLQRCRVRELLRVDPLRCLLRCNSQSAIRQYSVPCPNSLRHIDVRQSDPLGICHSWWR